MMDVRSIRDGRISRRTFAASAAADVANLKVACAKVADAATGTVILVR